MQSNEKGLKYWAEWPTLAILALCYATWIAVTLHGAALGPWLAIPLLALIVAQHSSLQHEVLHGHPFRSRFLSELLIFPAIGIFIPYGRFRALHLAHHHDPTLTDPYDDPETNFLDPAIWQGLPRWLRTVRKFNNTLLGRMIFGPAISVTEMLRADIRDMQRGDREIARHYLHHAAGLIPVAVWLSTTATIPFYAYVIGAYGGMSILKIRTFLEHRAHERSAARTVIIEDQGPLSLLFLNNNLHAVHHAHPGTAWFQLPQKYADRRAEFLRRNGNYFFRSYVDVFRQYFVRAKDPVPHPLRDAGRGVK